MATTVDYAGAVAIGIVKRPPLARARLVPEVFDAAGTMFVVAQSEIDRISDIAELALFGLTELDAASDLAVVDVQARYDTFCHHRGRLNRFAAREATAECAIKARFAQ